VSEPADEANASGVVWCCELDGSGGLRDIELEHVGTKEITWVHIQSDRPESARTLETIGLDAHACEVLTALDSRPRAIQHSQGVLVTLRGVNQNPGADPEDMISLRIWLSKNLIVTARKSHRRLMSVRDVRGTLDKRRGPRNVSEFADALITHLADRIGEVVDEFDDELSALEDAIESAHITGLRQELVEARRKTAALRRYLAPQREALEALFRMQVDFLDPRDTSIREQSDRTMRYVEDLDLARERALMLQDELRNRVAEQQNQRMYVLSLVTAIFLPLSFLTGVFGMNVAGLPGVENVNGFVYVALSMTAVALVIAAWMKLSRWY
jgi:zinc transporter